METTTTPKTYKNEQKKVERIEITLLPRVNGCNVTALIELNDKPGVFRFHYENKTRKNARYEDWQLNQIYFEGFEGTEKGNHSLTYELESYSDLLTFVSRRGQWFLERLRDLEKEQA